jgi:hypothetical protein
VLAYVETGAELYRDGAAGAWTFDLPHLGAGRSGRESHEHVLATLDKLPADLVSEHNGQEWTTVKVLRRLAWHEPGELAVLRRLLARARLSGRRG